MTRAALFDILTYNNFWIPSPGKNYSEYREDYETYMDIESVSEESLDLESSLRFDDIFNHSVYGIHIKMENNALSEERPHICIGWSAMGDLSDIATKDELSAKYDTK